MGPVFTMGESEDKERGEKKDKPLFIKIFFKLKLNMITMTTSILN